MKPKKIDRKSPPPDDSEAGLSFTADEEPIVQSIVLFIQSATYDEKRRLIGEHPELLSSKVDEIMARIVEVHRQHGTASDANGVQAWREFLADARAKNFDYALARSRIIHVFVEMPVNSFEWNACFGSA